jgi:transcriptional regulator with XRE-family HTH domain
LEKSQKKYGNDEKIVRLKTLLTRLGLSQKDFSKTIGISSTMMSNIMSGDRDLGWKHAYNIQAKFPNVNPQWLLKGEGEMFLHGKDLTVAEIYPIPEPETIADPEERAAWDRVRVLERENRELLETVMRLVKIMEDKNANKDV